MLALTGLFAWLGMWQVQRLAEKEALIADGRSPAARGALRHPPPSGMGHASTSTTYAYHLLTLTGRYLNDKAVLVFTNLPDPKGQIRRPRLLGHDRRSSRQTAAPSSSIAASSRRRPARLHSAPRDPTGEQTLTGIALRARGRRRLHAGPGSGQAHRMGPRPRAARRDGRRDRPRSSAFTVDAPGRRSQARCRRAARPSSSSPTTIWATPLTWFGFALITPLLAGLLDVSAALGPAESPEILAPDGPFH